MMPRVISEFVEHSRFVPSGVLTIEDGEITLEPSGAVDAHGNPVETWTEPASVGVYAFDPGSTSEPFDGQDRVITEPTLYYPADVVIGHRDRIIARDTRYEVDGDARLWVHPTQITRRANVVSLRRVEG